MNDNIQEKSIEELLSELKPRERNFILKYRELRRQGDAARAAGFPEKSADVQAHRLMQRDDVREIIKLLDIRDFERAGITDKSLVLTLSEIIERCMQQKPVERFNRETGETEILGEYEFDAKNAIAAVKEIKEILGLKTSKVKFENDDLNFVINVVE